MSTISFQLKWGPGLIGLTVAMVFYGVGVGQFVFYVRAFPREMLQLKALVLIVFILDSIQTLMSIWIYHHLLITCRLNDSPSCAIYIPTPLICDMFITFCLTFMVQCFYAHRVWIISGRNRVVTSAVFLSTTAQIVLGTLCTVALIRDPTWQGLRTIKFTPMAAVASAVCDTIITVSIMYYLRPARTGAIRRGNYIKKLNAVFIQMGLFTFINAAALPIMYYIQTQGVSQFLTAAPGVILGQTYTNSMLSVLNARKPIREQQEAEAQRPIELPTITTIG